MKAKRIIPCLDIKDGRVVKGVKFENLRDIADPAALAEYYSAAGADEIAFYDIAASGEGRLLFTGLLEKVASRVSVPLIAGGGVRCMEDFERLFQSGADKVSINSGALQNPALIHEAAAKYGKHRVTLSVDAKRVGERYAVFSKGGKSNTGLDVVEWVSTGERYGAGEIVLNSVDADGALDGFDLKLLAAVTEKVSLPVIASGGAGKKEDFLNLFRTLPRVDAGLAASVFHDKTVLIPQLKQYLLDNKIETRL